MKNRTDRIKNSKAAKVADLQTQRAYFELGDLFQHDQVKYGVNLQKKTHTQKKYGDKSFLPDNSNDIQGLHKSKWFIYTALWHIALVGDLAGQY